MATKNTTGQTPTVSAANKVTTYDLAIGILAIFSLFILVLIIFVPLQPSTEDLLNTLENLLCVVFLFDFFRSLSRAPKKWNYFLRGGGLLDLLGSLPIPSGPVPFPGGETHATRHAEPGQESRPGHHAPADDDQRNCQVESRHQRDREPDRDL